MANTLLITAEGRQAIADALANGTQVYPKTFKFITPIMAINDTFTANSIPVEDVWYTANITEYDVDNSATVSFNCIVEANLATHNTGTIALYFEDGTLFAICALSSQLPINQRQGVYLRINHDSATTAFNFNFLSQNDYLHETDSFFLGTTEVPLNRTTGSLTLNGVTAETSLNSNKLENKTIAEIQALIINAITNGAGTAYDTLLELQNEIQANDGDISGILTTLTQKLGKSGGTMTGNISFTEDEGGIDWYRNTDKAYIKYFNDSDSDENCRLEFLTGDNGSDDFVFMSQAGATLVELMRMRPDAGYDGLTYKGKQVWNDENVKDLFIPSAYPTSVDIPFAPRMIPDSSSDSAYVHIGTINIYTAYGNGQIEGTCLWGGRVFDFSISIASGSTIGTMGSAFVNIIPRGGTITADMFKTNYYSISETAIAISLYTYKHTYSNGSIRYKNIFGRHSSTTFSVTPSLKRDEVNLNNSLAVTIG